MRRQETTAFRRGGSDRGGFGFDRAKPVEVGKEYDVTISEISQRGDGITRIQGFVVFVAGAKAGEHLKIKVVEVGNRFAKGQIVSRTSQGKQG